MILEYYRNGTPEEQVKSLKENVQLAFNEHQMLIDRMSASYDSLIDKLDALEARYSALEARVAALEAQE